MNKKRYWKKQEYIANIIYNLGFCDRYSKREDTATRAYNVLGDIGDYLFNMEEE